MILPVLSSETLLHMFLSSEHSCFRPSSTAVVIQTQQADSTMSVLACFRKFCICNFKGSAKVVRFCFYYKFI